MAGFIPAIHVFFDSAERKTWMPGTRPGMTTNMSKQIPYQFPHSISANRRA
jgi:hypothetical protein